MLLLEVPLSILPRDVPAHPDVMLYVNTFPGQQNKEQQQGPVSGLLFLGGLICLFC